MARLVKLETNLGDIRPHTAKVFEEFAARYEIHFAWGIGASGHHKAGRALDLMAYERGGGPSNPGPIRKGWNRTVAEYARKNWKRLGIDYIIFDQLIMSNNPGGYAYGGADLNEWQDYPGESHANHVHISFEENPPAYRPPTTKEGAEADMPTVAEIWNTKLIPNKNAPSGPATGLAAPAGLLSNIEATQDVDHGLLVKMSAQLGAINGAVAELAKALAAHAGEVDPDALVAAVRGASEAGALAALEAIPVATVIAKEDQA